jgi:hypothetical protein
LRLEGTLGLARSAAQIREPPLLGRGLLPELGEPPLGGPGAGPQLSRPRLGRRRFALGGQDPVLERGELARGPALSGQRALELAGPLLRGAPARLGRGQGFLAGAHPAAPLDGEPPAGERREEEDARRDQRGPGPGGQRCHRVCSPGLPRVSRSPSPPADAAPTA